MADATAVQRRLARIASSLRERGRRIEPFLYASFAAGCTLWVACRFYGSLRLQTLYSKLWLDPKLFARVPALLGDWSAPLDDVFIHFDFARATARGHPFQWSEGNGYSSGGTSVLYPLVLAIGYWLPGSPFRKLELMVWAGVVATTSVFALCLAGRRLHRGLPRATSYLVPPALLSVGALSWSLFSGMEVAFFLALFGGALVAWDDLVVAAQSREDVAPKLGVLALLLGAWGVTLIATRPEGVTTVAVLAISAGVFVQRARGFRAGTLAIAMSAVPGAVFVLCQSIANFVLTGDAAAAGALTKLEIYHPFLTRSEVFDFWWFHTKYQVLRLAGYHLTDSEPWGWIPFALAAVALVPRATRRFAIVLVSSAALWIAIVGLNGQVRWQNERYSMPALAFIVLAASLGAGVLVTHAWALGRRGTVMRASSRVAVAAAIALFAWHEHPRFIEQIWFFGRASRNILEQHVRAGQVLRYRVQPPPHRVLVGDAGAIPYSSDLPALDIIGLGGYHRLPFARASQLGVGAIIELIERIPAADRPDVFAIYPHWWDALPLWFGERLPPPDGAISVRGNVICAGASKVLYRADWSPLDHSREPLSLKPDEVVVDELDFADLVSEREHHYKLSQRTAGAVQMKLLADPRRADERLWDAGRVLGVGVTATFELHGLTVGRAARLLFRVAPARPGAFAVLVDGARIGELDLTPSDEWRDVALRIGADRVRERLTVELEAIRGDRIDYHVWAVQPR